MMELEIIIGLVDIFSGLVIGYMIRWILEQTKVSTWSKIERFELEVQDMYGGVLLHEVETQITPSSVCILMAAATGKAVLRNATDLGVNLCDDGKTIRVRFAQRKIENSVQVSRKIH
jgi:hypothetical protein